MNNAMMDFLTKDGTVTIRMTREEKNRIKEKAEKRDMSTSAYMKETAMAGLERRRSRDRRKVIQMVERQEILNDIWRRIKQEGASDSVCKMIEELLEKEKELWQCL